jgi:hypothetical protein
MTETIFDHARRVPPKRRFTCGAVPEDDGGLKLYRGAADNV